MLKSIILILFNSKWGWVGVKEGQCKAGDSPHTCIQWHAVSLSSPWASWW